MIEQIGFWLLNFFLLWVFFVNVMWLKHNKEKIPKWLYYPAVGFAAIGFIYDVLFNIIYGTIMFIQMPDFKGANSDLWGIPLPTLSERMRDILKLEKRDTLLNKYRWYLSLYICRYLIEPWDAGHCGIKNL